MTNKLQRYTDFYFCKPLYRFRVDPPPIIRSTTLYLQHLVFVKQLLLPAAIAAGSSNCLALHLVGQTLEYIYVARTPRRKTKK